MSSTSGQSTLFAPSHRKRSDDERFKLTAKQYLGRPSLPLRLLVHLPDWSQLINALGSKPT
eukprot:2236538-Rhodomonas_salina.1